jgi:hypothetical protein
VLCHQITPDKAWKPFGDKQLALIPFVDAGDNYVTLKTFELTVLDCIRGLFGAANRLGWFTLKGFDPELYERDYSLMDGCDLNWIIPNKMCALSSPNS